VCQALKRRKGRKGKDPDIFELKKMAPDFEKSRDVKRK
jgi:hypothetical protein